VLAANPCPCGLAFGKGLACTCTPMQRRTYTSRLAGPILDRIDIQVHVPAPSRATLAMAAGEPSRVVAARVAAARAAQRDRWQGLDAEVNARVPGSLLRSGRFRLPARCTEELDRAVDRGMLSLRGYDRCLRLAWTVADLGGRTVPGREDVGLALALRHRQAVAA
jgi:magnesium chelatase family protein